MSLGFSVLAPAPAFSAGRSETTDAPPLLPADLGRSGHF